MQFNSQSTGSWNTSYVMSWNSSSVDIAIDIKCCSSPVHKSFSLLISLDWANFCSLDRGKKHDRNCVKQFNQKTKSKAAVQEADRLAQELAAKELENEELDEDVERLLGKYAMEAEERRKQVVHIILLKLNYKQPSVQVHVQLLHRAVSSCAGERKITSQVIQSQHHVSFSQFLVLCFTSSLSIQLEN